MNKRDPKVHAQIFWPSCCIDSPSGYIIGWNIRSFIACVAGVVSDIKVLLPVLESHCEVGEFRELLEISSTRK